MGGLVGHGNATLILSWKGDGSGTAWFLFSRLDVLEGARQCLAADGWLVLYHTSPLNCVCWLGLMSILPLAIFL